MTHPSPDGPFGPKIVQVSQGQESYLEGWCRKNFFPIILISPPFVCPDKIGVLPPHSEVLDTVGVIGGS